MSAVLILLVLFQGDAGTAVVMAVIAAGMLWVVGAPLRVLMALASAGVAGVVAIFLTSPVRMRRLTAFLDPTLDLTGANHQANAGMFAIASGGWWGVGLGASRQKWGSLPEAHTDFIFAVLGEEFGLFGSLVVLYDRHLGLCRHPDRVTCRRFVRSFCRWWYHYLVHGAGADQSRSCTADASDRWGAAAAGLLRGLRVGGQFAGRRGPARLRAPGT